MGVVPLLGVCHRNLTVRMDCDFIVAVDVLLCVNGFVLGRTDNSLTYFLRVLVSQVDNVVDITVDKMDYYCRPIQP